MNSGKEKYMDIERCRIKRRRMLADGAAFLGLAAYGSAIPALLSGCESTTMKSTGKTYDFDTSTEAALGTVGGGVKKKLNDNNGGNPVLIIRTNALDFLVVTTVCTHQGCPVNLPAKPGENITCPCHGSEYSPVDGSVVTGPAPAGLRKFNSVFDSKTQILKISF